MAFVPEQGLRPFEEKLWLSSPTMHGEELDYMRQAHASNWMSTLGENIDQIERSLADKLGRGYAVALSSGTASLHLATRLAGYKLYGKPPAGGGSLRGHKVFASDLTFAASVNPILYEGGEPVFIDCEAESWNMDPAALERAFALYPEVKLVVLAQLYGSPGRMAELLDVCRRHGALLLEDAAESLGADVLMDGRWVQTGALGDLSCLSFNGNKIITGSSGGMFLCDEEEDAALVRQWSTQSREPAAWYQHEHLGYNYRMSNVIAGVVRGQLPHLEEHIARKAEIYRRYREGFRDLPVAMNPFVEESSRPNFWLSCLLLDEAALCPQERDALTAGYAPQPGKSCPTEILEVLAAHNAEGRPLWKPMHLQPLYRDRAFVSAEAGQDLSAALFRRGLCLPSDNKMGPEQQDRVIELVRRCFA